MGSDHSERVESRANDSRPHVARSLDNRAGQTYTTSRGRANGGSRYFDAINAKLLASFPALVPQWLPDGRREQREWVARNPTRADRRAGSFRVNLLSGKWADFATGDRGCDPVSLYAYLFTNGRQGEAARELGGGTARACRDHAPAKAAKVANASSDEAARVERARAIYRAAVPIAGMIAERYLLNRGLNAGPAWEGLRAATLSLGGQERHPALVAPVWTLSGRLEGVQRVFLTPDGRKLPTDAPKRSMGRVSGGAIRLGEPAGELIVCEGLEDGLALAQELEGAAVWVAAGASMLPLMRLPAALATVTVAADNDAAGEAAAARAAEAFAARGKRVRVMRPAPGFKDWNDQLRGVRQ